MRLRSSAEILGLPTDLRDRSRQYDWNPARCQRMIVSGRRIAIALRTEGNQRSSQTNRKRSVLLSCGRFDTCRRSTLSCWRRIRISATSFVLGLKNEAMIGRISRRNSIIKWQGYRVSASRLAESNFRYTQPDHPRIARLSPMFDPRPASLCRRVQNTDWPRSKVLPREKAEAEALSAIRVASHPGPAP